jgi:hypothetical protein
MEDPIGVWPSTNIEIKIECAKQTAMRKNSEPSKL